MAPMQSIDPVLKFVGIGAFARFEAGSGDGVVNFLPPCCALMRRAQPQAVADLVGRAADGETAIPSG